MKRIPLITASKGFTLLRLVKSLFLIMALLSLFFSGLQIWKENHQLEPVLKEIGGKVFNPIYELQLTSEKIADNGFYPKGDFFFLNIWEFLKNIYFFLLPLINIYFIFHYLFLFSKYVLISDSSRDFPAFLVTLVIFTLLQFLYIVKFTDLPLITPFTSLRNVFNLVSKMF